MVKYRYTATDEQGGSVAGEVAADSADAATALLLDRGYREVHVTALTEHASSGDSGGRLSADETEQLTRHVAEIAAAGLPLGAGLRAAAAESPSHRLSSALRTLASSIETGNSLESALEALRGRLPNYVSGLMQAAASTGKLGDVLAELVEYHRAARQRWRSVLSAITYPGLVIAVTIALVLIIELFLVRSFSTLFEEFQIRLPLPTRLLVWSSETGLAVGVVVLIGVLIGALLARLILGAALFRRLLSKIPLFGPLWEWSGVAEMTRLLAMLMQQQVPLPMALGLAADGIRDANVRQVCQALAERTEQGQPLSDMLSQERRLPALLAAIVRSGEQSGSLPKAFGVASEIYEGRVMLRALVLRTILPPLAFLLVAIAMVFIIGSLLTPMLSLLNGLSAGRTGPAAAESLGALNLIGLILLGAALLWTVYLVYGRRGLTSDDALKRILIIAAWTMIFMGALGLITGLTGFAAVALWLIIPVVVIISVHKYRVSESRALLWVLAIAAERGIPLERVVRAFADGRSDEMGLRALRLADLLDAGVPLPAALRQSRHPLPRDAVLAVGIGCEMGQLGPALRQVIVRYEEFGSMLEALLWKLFYLMLLVGFIMLIVFFVSLKIVPVYGMIMADFGLAMPALTDWVIASGDAIAQFWLVPFAFLLLLGLAICLLYYLNWMPIDLPLLGRSRLRYDGALIMRSLALAVRRNHALGDVLRMLAWQYPRANVRARLWRVGEQMRQGEDWCESLRRVRLIANADAAVLKAAQRVGNLAWALDEMADSSLRRWAYRLRAVLNVVFPLLLLAIGIFVMLIVIGLFLPLIKLIEGLT